MAIIGIAMGGSYIPLMSTVTRWFTKRRAVMTGIVGTGMGIGQLILPPVANQLISTYDWRVSYIILGSIVSVVVVLLAQFLRRDPEQMGLLPDGNKGKEENPILDVVGFSLREAIRTRQFWMLCVIFFCFMFTLHAITAHIVAHAIGLGISTTAAVNILAVMGGLLIPSSLVMGHFADRAGNRPVMIIGFIFTSVALFLFLVASEIWMLYLFAVIYGLGRGSVSILFSPTTAELFGLRSVGVIYGVAMAAGVIGGTVSPILTGHIFDITGSYQPAFLAAALASVTGVILASLLRPIKGVMEKT